MHACTHTQQKTRIHRPQKTSQLDRKFWSAMAVQTGLKLKVFRTSMWTTRAQCGGRTSTRSHVDKGFVGQLERMAETASPLWPTPYHQAPSWTFLYAWKCRSMSSTSSLFSGILLSWVQQQRRCARDRMQTYVCNQYTHTHKYLCVKSRRHASLCHTPRKSRPHTILTWLTCECHSQTWTEMYVCVACDFL